MIQSTEGCKIILSGWKWPSLKGKKKSEERGEKEMVGVGVGFEGDV